MFEYKLLVLSEDDMVGDHIKQSAGGDRPMWEAHHVVLVKDDGSTEVLKDRWAGPGAPKVELHLP